MLRIVRGYETRNRSDAGDVSQREMNEAVAAVIDLAGYREAMGR
jgi:hypothetical protein